MKIKHTFAATVTAIAMMTSGVSYANDFNIERDLGLIEKHINEYVNAVCDLDTDKLNSVTNRVIHDIEERFQASYEDCNNRGGVDRVSVTVSPNFNFTYSHLGLGVAETRVHFKDDAVADMNITFTWESPEKDHLVISHHPRW